MYVDDLVIVAEHREELQGELEEWNEMFKKHYEPRLDKIKYVGLIGKHAERERS